MNSTLKVSLPKTIVDAISLQKKSTIHRIEDPPQGLPRYKINGEAFFSVTQILDDGRFTKVDPLKLGHAQVLGSVVHLFIENYLNNQPIHQNIENTLDTQKLKLFNFLPPADENIWNDYLYRVHDPNNVIEELVLKNKIQKSFDLFLDFLMNHSIEVIFAEEVVWNSNFLYAGTVDLACYLDNKLTIIDHKTSRFIRDNPSTQDTYAGQLSAYVTALNQMGKGSVENITDLCILHLNPKGSKPKIIHRKFNFEIFLKALSKFSKTEISSSLPNTSEIDDTPSINSIFKKYKCPDNNCKEISEFPFPNNTKNLEENHVHRLAKIDLHEENNHYAIFQVQIPNFTVSKNFIHKLN